MSMPEFPSPNPEFTQEQALTMILSSIALEEVALSHIINAEGEKIQYILSQANCGPWGTDLNDILAVNKSVSGLLDVVLQNQMILKNKMEKVLDYLPKPPAPPPCPPMRPPGSCFPCSMWRCPFERPVCFDLCPGDYCQCEAFRWHGENAGECFFVTPEDCSKIKVPRTGAFAVDLYLDTGRSPCSSGKVELVICCADKAPIVKTLCLTQPKNKCFLHGETAIQLPCSCSPCYASVFPCEPMDIRKGCIMFTRI